MRSEQNTAIVITIITLLIGAGIIFLFIKAFRYEPVSEAPSPSPSSSLSLTPSPSPMPMPTPTPSPSPTSNPEFAAIPGSDVINIEFNMEELWYIPDQPPEASANYDGIIYSSSVDFLEDCELSYYISASSDFEVILAEFYVNSYAGKDADDLAGIAGAYLSFCAGMPYDTADTESARAWVKEAIGKVGELGHLESTVIGDTQFTLYGVDGYNYTLEITHVK